MCINLMVVLKTMIKRTFLFRSLLTAAIALAVLSCERSPRPVDSKEESTKRIDKLDVVPKTNQSATDSSQLLGVWYDEGIKTPEGANVAYQIIANDIKVFIQPIAFKGKKFQVSDQPVISSSATELKREGNHYVSIDSPEDAYEVDKDGNLLIFHEGKLIVVCKKIL